MKEACRKRMSIFVVVVKGQGNQFEIQELLLLHTHTLLTGDKLKPKTLRKSGQFHHKVTWKTYKSCITSNTTITTTLKQQQQQH